MFVALVLCEKVASVAWKNLASIYAIICSQKSDNRLKNKNNTLVTSKKKSSEEFSANFLKERQSAKNHLAKELNKYNASTQAIADGSKNSTADFINRFFEFIF